MSTVSCDQGPVKPLQRPHRLHELPVSCIHAPRQPLSTRPATSQRAAQQRLGGGSATNSIRSSACSPLAREREAMHPAGARTTVIR